MPLPSSIRQSVKEQGTNLLRTGRRFRRFDEIRQRHFWSSHLFGPDANGYVAAGQFPLFATPPGQVGQGFPVPLTQRETNWKSANRVPDNQNFEVLEIGVTAIPVPGSLFGGNPPPTADQTVQGTTSNLFLENTLVAISYLTNVVELGYSQDFAQAAGPQQGTYIPFEEGGLGTRQESRYTTNGFSAPGLRRRFKIPILLQHGETFNFTFLIDRSFYTGTDFIYARIDFWATESFVEKS